MSLKEILMSYRKENGTLSQIRVADEEQELYRKMSEMGEALPEGVYEGKNEYGKYFYRVPNIEDLTKEEWVEMVLHCQLKSINTIKGCVIFFTVLTVISLILTLILSILSAAAV